MCTQVCTLHAADTSSMQAIDPAVSLVTVQQLRSKKSKTWGPTGLVKVMPCAVIQAGWWELESKQNRALAPNYTPTEAF